MIEILTIGMMTSIDLVIIVGWSTTESGVDLLLYMMIDSYTILELFKREIHVIYLDNLRTYYKSLQYHIFAL